MGPVIYVRVIDWTCDICRDALIEDCRAARLDLPTGAFAFIPEHWRERKCPHDKGFSIDVIGPTPVSDDVDASDPAIDQSRIESIEQAEQPSRAKNRWRDLFPDTIDGSKGIGYPVREVGHYGSYSQHDGFDDESES